MLQKGLNEGAAKLRAALWLEEKTGIPMTGAADSTRVALATKLRHAWGSLPGPSAISTKSDSAGPSDDSRQVLLHELSRAANGAEQIAIGAARAHHEVSSMLEDPVGRRALDRLMVTPETVRDHPEILRSFAAYIAPGGQRPRSS